MKYILFISGVIVFSMFNAVFAITPVYYSENECDISKDLKKYSEILQDDIVVKAFLQKYPAATSFPASGIDESDPPQTSVHYKHEDGRSKIELNLHIIGYGIKPNDCFTPFSYTLNYQDDVRTIQIINYEEETQELLDFLNNTPNKASHYRLLAPLQQLKSGIAAEDIQCKEGLYLVIKAKNDSPACVKPTSVEKLVAWGWAKTKESIPITENDIIKNELIRPKVTVVNGSADVAVGIPLTEIATSSTGSRVEYDVTGVPTFMQDNGSIQLTLYHGTTSGSNHVIAATIKNIGDRVVYVGSLDIEGMVPIPSGAPGFVSVLQAPSGPSSIEEATLQPGESLTAYIVGDWSVMGIPVTGFGSGVTYSHEHPDANYRFGFNVSTPIQWIP